MNMEQNRSAIIKDVSSALKENAVMSLTITHPPLAKVKAASCPLKAARNNKNPSQPGEDMPISELKKMIFSAPDVRNTPNEETAGSEYQSAFQDDAPDEPMSPKQRYKIGRLQEKEKRRDDKAFSKMRKAVKKRGFGTGVLYELDDPADIYSMSNEEIKQVEFSGVINEDAFYDFNSPADASNISSMTKTKKTYFIIIGFLIVILGIMLILINNIMSIF